MHLQMIFGLNAVIMRIKYTYTAELKPNPKSVTDLNPHP